MPNQTNNPHSVQQWERPIRINALAATDHRGMIGPSPVSMLIQRPSQLHAAESVHAWQIMALDTPYHLDRHPASAKAHVITDMADCGGGVGEGERGGRGGGGGRGVIIPGLINAHTHLDLTHIGPIAHDPAEGFVRWVDQVRQQRCTEPQAITASVMLGIESLQSQGVVAVGDIAGAPNGVPSLVPWQTLCKSGLMGVSFLEFFGIGTSEQRSQQQLNELLTDYLHEQDSGEATSRCLVQLGLQPHAPNTVSRDLYAWAVSHPSRLPMATHLAETPEERQFIATGAGPQRELLERLGVWDDRIMEHIGKGLHPVEHLADVLAQRPILVAHVNDAPDEAIDLLARTNTRMVYCPRASAYFGAEQHFGPHRYQEMLDAGVCVTLGTDSIINLPANDQGCASLSVLDEARHLYHRDKTDPGRLLAMATINASKALGLDPKLFEINQGHTIAGLSLVKVGDDSRPDGQGALQAVLRSHSAPRLIGF